MGMFILKWICVDMFLAAILLDRELFELFFLSMRR